jgi:hypothetical protein
VPGTYASAGPVPDGVCYWKRTSGGSLVDNAMSKKPQVVQVQAGDTSFTTNDCQPWQLTTAAPPPPGNPMDLLSQFGKFVMTAPKGPTTGSAEAPAAAPTEEPAPAEPMPTEHMAPSGEAPGTP